MERIVALIPLLLAMSMTAIPDTGLVAASKIVQSLSYFDVELNFPTEADPGATITVQAIVHAKQTVRVAELNVRILAYYGPDGFRILLDQMLAQDTRVYSGDTLQREWSLKIPEDATRSALVAYVVERVRVQFQTLSFIYVTNAGRVYYYYYYYPYYYGYTSSYDATTSTVVPLTYVKAKTPEFIQLSAQYQDLTNKLNDVSGELARLRADHVKALSTINELQATLQTKNAEINSLRMAVAYLWIGVGTLSAAIVALTALFVSSKKKQSAKTS